MAAPTHLISLELVFTCISSLGLRHLAKVISMHTTLENITLRTTATHDDNTALMHDYSQLVGAALSCTSVKHVVAKGLPFRFRESDIPSVTKGVHLTVDLDSYVQCDIFEVRLLEVLCSIVEVCKIPSVILYGESTFLSPQVSCHFLSAFNRSLGYYSMQNALPPLDPCDCKYLSRALRRDPAISPYNLNRSKSLTDLTTVRQRESPEPFRTFADHHHSCPNLLEIQSLRDVHDTIRQDVCPWLNLNLSNAFSSFY